MNRGHGDISRAAKYPEMRDIGLDAVERLVGCETSRQKGDCASISAIDPVAIGLSPIGRREVGILQHRPNSV